MPRLIAFLRAINVGGRTVRMQQLVEAFEALGFAGVETFIASGNVIFETSKEDRHAIEQKIQKQLQSSLGYEVKTFLRSDAEVTAIAQYQPFGERKMRAAEAFNIGFLQRPLSSEAAKCLMSLRSDIDDFHVHGTEIYWLCRTRQSDSKFSNALFERKTGAPATFRGAKTIARLAAKLAN